MWRPADKDWMRWLTKSSGRFRVKQHWVSKCLPTPTEKRKKKAAEKTPHFYALSQGKQTEPCSAGAWLILPPLLWVIWGAVSTRGMELALTGVDFRLSITATLKMTSNSTSANALICLSSPLKNCVASHGRGLHYLLHICIIKIISAMTARMKWHPCEYNVNVHDVSFP